MWGFFNKQNGWRAAAQAYNGLAICCAAYSYYMHPQPIKSEIIAEILVSGVSAYTLGEDTHTLFDVTTFALNMFAVGMVYGFATSGASSFGTVLNVVNGLGYLASGAVSLMTTETETPKTENSITPK